MADQPIGISFIPSTQNQAAGPQSLRTDGGTGAGSTDLAAAYKILSLRLPQVVGAQAPTPQTNLTSAGSAGLPKLPGGLDPHAALFQAFIKSILGGGDPMAMTGMGGGSAAASSSIGGDPSSMAAGSDLPGALRPAPKITFGDSATKESSADPSAGSSGVPSASVPPEDRVSSGYY